MIVNLKRSKIVAMKEDVETFKFISPEVFSPIDSLRDHFTDTVTSGARLLREKYAYLTGGLIGAAYLGMVGLVISASTGYLWERFKPESPLTSTAIILIGTGVAWMGGITSGMIVVNDMKLREKSNI